MVIAIDSLLDCYLHSSIRQSCTSFVEWFVHVDELLFRPSVVAASIAVSKVHSMLQGKVLTCREIFPAASPSGAVYVAIPEKPIFPCLEFLRFSI